MRSRHRRSFRPRSRTARPSRSFLGLHDELDQKETNPEEFDAELGGKGGPPKNSACQDFVRGWQRERETLSRTFFIKNLEDDPGDERGRDVLFLLSTAGKSGALFHSAFRSRLLSAMATSVKYLFTRC